jgi:hypothetical protein
MKQLGSLDVRPKSSGEPNVVNALEEKALINTPENKMMEGGRVAHGTLTGGQIETNIDLEDPGMYGVGIADKHQTSLILDNDYARPDYARKPKNSYTKIGR